MNFTASLIWQQLIERFVLIMTKNLEALCRGSCGAFCRRKRQIMSFKVFFSIFSSGSHFVQQNHLSNFGRGSPNEHFYEVILKSGHMPRYHL